MTVEEVKVIQDKIKVKQDELTRAEGRKDQLMAQLKEEFDCGSIADAEQLIEKLTDQIKEASVELESIGDTIQDMLTEGIV